jgi:hypothetical protein
MDFRLTNQLKLMTAMKSDEERLNTNDNIRTGRRSVFVEVS